VTPEGSLVVRESWNRLRGREERVAAGFYARLFSLEPELRHLFVLTDMEGLREKLTATLGLILDHLDDPALLAGQVRASAKRHAAFGLGVREYRLGGEALLWSLSRELGEAYTPEVQAAWAEAYTLLADLMLKEGVA
jgi:hemoglobin-like flavoprotein